MQLACILKEQRLGKLFGPEDSIYDELY